MRPGAAQQEDADHATTEESRGGWKGTDFSAPRLSRDG
jgi:hypothetical protein